MANKRNEIMEEQRRAREEFIKLKKMQSGEIEPQAKPSEVAVSPKTFKEKLQNYWYHFKFHTIMVVALVIIITITTVQCATREKYDFSVLYFAYTPVIDAQLEGVEKYIESFAEDIDGNGEVNVQVINCSVSDSERDAGRTTIFTKVQTVIVADNTAMLYMVDDKSIEYFENGFDKSIFVEEPIKMGRDFYKKAVKDERLPLQEDLKLGLRIIDGTTFEDDEDAQRVFAQSKKVLEKIKKQNG